jgi:DNA repair protein RecN (Recombination protein N)
MLEEISIHNLGVISHTRLPFTKGLTVITGETGAGKTMVLTALQLLLGKRSDPSIVRHGKEFTSIEGCWNVSGLQVLPNILETGAVIEDDQLFINRTVHADGKSRAVLGGKTTPASVLAKIGGGLVNIHGQSDQIRLKSSNAQLDALDRYAGELLNETLKKYVDTFSEWKQLTKTIKDVKMNAVARQREFDDLTVAVEEISKVNPTVNEDDTLKKEISTLVNIDALKNSAVEALTAIDPEDYEATNVLSQLGIAVKVLQNTAEYDPIMQEAYTKAETVLTEAQELSGMLHSYLNNLDDDSLTRLDEAQERLSELNRLIRKYGVTINDVLEYWQNADEKLIQLNPETNNIQILENQFKDLDKTLHDLAQSVTVLRKNAAKSLVEKVNKELAGLAMAGNKLVIEITDSSYTNTGKDEINFMLQMPGATNPRPISKAASGGELSRIMLALEVVLANPEITPTFIFDEVDSGVGGSTAIEIGKRLSSLATEAQVIVVTHLPQVAAYADNHLRVQKSSTDTFTETSVEQLSFDERLEELARMLSGMQNSETGRAHAAELLEHAQIHKNNVSKNINQ